MAAYFDVDFLKSAFRIWRVFCTFVWFKILAIIFCIRGALCYFRDCFIFSINGWNVMNSLPFCNSSHLYVISNASSIFYFHEICWCFNCSMLRSFHKWRSRDVWSRLLGPKSGDPRFLSFVQRRGSVKSFPAVLGANSVLLLFMETRPRIKGIGFWTNSAVASLQF